jgi:hypothetical protein
MDHSLDIRCVFVGMAGDTDVRSSGGDQLYSRNVFVNSDFVANVAPKRNGGMDDLTLGFVFVTGSTFRGVGVLIELDWVDISHGWYPQEHDQTDRRDEVWRAYHSFQGEPPIDPPLQRTRVAIFLVRYIVESTCFK